MNERNIVIVNGNLCDASEYDALINSQEAYAYEVIRVIEGKPLFLEDHLERLKNVILRRSRFGRISGAFARRTVFRRIT